MPFLRAGWADSSAALYNGSVSAGFGYLTPQQDLFGCAVNWASPAAPGLGNQWTAEVFFKYQVTETFAITPDIQLIFNPALNPTDNVVAIAGLRARVAS